MSNILDCQQFTVQRVFRFANNKRFFANMFAKFCKQLAK